jgi:putative FmdB family regulatory protein
MPTYEYRCPEGHTFELFQRMSDPRPDACEVCGAAPVERVLSAPAVHFKGSGFYSTDYGKGKRKKDGAGEESGGSDTKKTETKSDSAGSEKKSGATAD